MASFNKIAIVGHLGRDPEIRYTPSGDSICNFSVATTEKRKDVTGEPRETTTWFRVTAWGRSAEACNEYLAKGAQVFVEGRLRLSEYSDREGNQRTSLEVNATDVQFLRRAGQAGERDADPVDRAPAKAKAAPAKAETGQITKEQSRAAMVAQGADEEDIPF